jgi:putative transposase
MLSKRSGHKEINGCRLAAATAGTADELGLHSHTIQRVCREYEKSRKAKKKPWLRYRGCKSLGWVPSNTSHVSFDGEALTFRGVRYEPMHLRDIRKPGIKIGAGSFNQDSHGRCYINCPIEVECAASAPNTRVGIDLGLNTLAAVSDAGDSEIPQCYRTSEAKLATAQRTRKTPQRIRGIHGEALDRGVQGARRKLIVCRQCEPVEIGQDQHGEERSRRRLVGLQGHRVV